MAALEKENRNPVHTDSEDNDVFECGGGAAGDAGDDKPVIAPVREGYMRQVTTSESPPVIVIALDASEDTEHAVRWYINKIHKPGNKIIFVHCVELPEMSLTQARSLHMR